jgi:RNA polymerase sigma-70 factor (ECF subfamily)
MEDDREAGRLLFMRYALFIYRLAYRTTLNKSVAEDISQEVWLKIFQKLDLYQQGTSFRSWSAAICYRSCVDYVRKSQRQQEIDYHALRTLFYPEKLLPIDLAEQNEFVEKVLVFLQRLPETLRIAFSLRYFEEMSYQEIGHVLECPAQTARTRVFRVTQSLKEQFSVS